MPPPWMMMMMSCMMPKPELLSAAAMMTMQSQSQSHVPPTSHGNSVDQSSIADSMASLHQPSFLSAQKQTAEEEEEEEEERSHEEMQQPKVESKTVIDGEQSVPSFVHDSQSASAALASNDMFKYYLDSIRHRHVNMRQQLAFVESIAHKPYEYTRLCDVKNVCSYLSLNSHHREY
jgi:hypothetical protein